MSAAAKLPLIARILCKFPSASDAYDGHCRVNLVNPQKTYKSATRLALKCFNSEKENR